MAEQQTPASVVERLRQVANLGEYLRSATTQFDRDTRVPEYARRRRLTTAAAQDAINLIERLSAEREAHVKALRFYADEHECPSDGPWGLASSDFGDIARAALTQGESRQAREMPEAVALSDMREIAVGLGYPSILEALEDLDRLKSGWQDIVAERRRQIEVEGWAPEHDDRHRSGQLATAAAVYALTGSSSGRASWDKGQEPSLTEQIWSWDWSWFKPTGSARRDLVKAGALIIAEIERLDRALPAAPTPADGGGE
jgi:hypothetical protein